MSETSYPNTLIYECSSENASVNISENEWINSFKEGINLDEGDTIRILGSFINEKGSGDQIEITEENNKFTLQYLPVHNIYQYNKISDDYLQPKDSSRYDFDKLQYSQCLNFEAPRIYNAGGDPILSCPPNGRATRWSDGLPFGTKYCSQNGYNNIDPNKHYLDCELVKSITCPVVDGIQLIVLDQDITQARVCGQIDFDTTKQDPWGGSKNMETGDELQLGFGSSFMNFRSKANPAIDLDVEYDIEAAQRPTGVSGKILGVKYTTNKREYIDYMNQETYGVGELPMITFLVGNHINTTKEFDGNINKPVNGLLNDAYSSQDPIPDERADVNVMNGAADANGKTWTYDGERQTTGFSSGTEGMEQNSIYYEFYNTGGQCLDIQNTLGSNKLVGMTGIKKVPSGSGYKLYYTIQVSQRVGGTQGQMPLLIPYRFLKPYDPLLIDDTLGNRVYLPITMSEPELRYNAPGVSAVDPQQGTLRKYNNVSAGQTGGFKIGNWGAGSQVPAANLTNVMNSYLRQPIRPGFQTNFNMVSQNEYIPFTNNTLQSQIGLPGANPLTYENLFERMSGGYPSTNYLTQLQDIVDYKQDFYMIQPRRANFVIPVGFYTPDRLANVINDQLHFNTDKYKDEFGDGNATDINLHDNWTYQPGFVSGNFVSAKIPEVNGGIIPPETRPEDFSGSTAQRQPGLALDNEDFIFKTDQFDTGIYRSAEYIVSKLATPDGSLISTPLKDVYNDPEAFICCPLPMAKYEADLLGEVDAGGGAVSRLFNGDTPGGVYTDLRIPNQNNGDTSINTWLTIVKEAFDPLPIFMGVGTFRGYGELENKDMTTLPFEKDKVGEGVLGRVVNEPFGNMGTKFVPQDTLDYYKGFTVGQANRFGGGFINGGLSRFFSGSNDLTFLYDQDEERFAFANTYTPFRPAGFENTQDKEEFTVDDAVPSVLINTNYTGYFLYSTSQIYIFSLAARPVCAQSSNNDLRMNSGGLVSNPNFLSDQKGAIDLWNSIGFVNLPTYSASDDDLVINSDPWYMDMYKQIGYNQSEGKAPIFNEADLNPSANAANPAKSECLIMIPNREFLIQTLSDEFKATNPASLTTYPFYLIGSSIPSSFYHGSDTGTVLPVVGLCSRNFSAGSFVFDLSQSSVQWTISEKITLTSIRTKIMKNDFSDATNLFGNSSVVYAITKNEFYKGVPEDQLQKIELQREKDIAKEAKAYDNAPIPIQPPITYIIPSVPYQTLSQIDDDSD